MTPQKILKLNRELKERCERYCPHYLNCKKNESDWEEQMKDCFEEIDN